MQGSLFAANNNDTGRIFPLNIYRFPAMSSYTCHAAKRMLPLLIIEAHQLMTLLPADISGPGMSWNGPITSFIICK